MDRHGEFTTSIVGWNIRPTAGKDWADLMDVFLVETMF